MNFQNIETKQDSAAKLLETQGKPTRHYLFAKEFNEINERTIQAYIDRLAQTATFHWGAEGEFSKHDNARFQSNNFDKVWLLKIKLEDDFIFSQGSVSLVLERYRKKRKQGSTDTNTAKLSGWRTPAFSEDEVSLNYDERKASMLITEKETLLDFGQEHFFVTISGFNKEGSIIKGLSHVKGIKSVLHLDTTKSIETGCYIRFRLKVNIADVEYLSVPTRTIKMIAYLFKGMDYSDTLFLSYRLT